VTVDRVDFGSLTVNVTDTPKSNDLVAFAKALAAANVRFLGAAWHADTTRQLELFEDGQEFVPFTEVTNYQTDANRGFNAVAQQNNITQLSQLPTWIFPSGTRTGVLTLAEIATASGVAIPQNNRPTLIGLDDVALLGGSPLHVPLNAYDPTANERLTFTVTSSNPALVQPTLVKGNNRSATIDVNGYGKLNFLLFEDRAERATERMIDLSDELVNGKQFYDGNKFHRIINNFVIQGGDPTGTGSGGSAKGDFDDQFHVDLQHNRTGILSMAKSTEDTNDSQFFITEGPQRHLDFNHTIFGQLVEGEKIRAAMSDSYAPGSRPNPELSMKSISVFNDTENSMVMLKAAEGATGTANVTVTVSDQTGHSFEETFAVTVSPDTINGEPFLADIDPTTLRTVANTPLEFDLESTDVEGNPVFYFGEETEAIADFLTVDKATGKVMVTPPANFVGILEADVWVTSTDNANRNGAFDEQHIEISVTPGKPSVDLAAASDSGSSNSDNITNATSLQFQVANVQPGAVVELFRQTNGTTRTPIGQQTATGNTVTITTTNLTTDGQFQIVASQTVTVGEETVTSDLSDILTVTIDRTVPDAFPATPVPPTEGMAGRAVPFDADHPNEGDAGFAYSLVNAPARAIIDANSGILAWIPTDDQVGPQTFSIRMSDAAGNFVDQPVAIVIAPDRLVEVTLVAADLEGKPVEAVITGDEFLLQVFVDDLRTTGNLGVRAAFLDVTYDATRLSVMGPIQFGASFPNDREGITTTAGLIDEAGASTTSNLGGDRALLWSVRMKANTAGTNLAIEGNLAEDEDFMLAGLNQAIPDGNITFIPATLQVTSTVFAQSDTATVNEDSGATTIDVLVNDLLGLTATGLTITSARGATNGTVAVANDRLSLTYRPNANFNGQETFTYTIKANNNAETHTGTVRVTVNPVNDNPVANDDTISVAEDASNFVLNVLTNDTIGPDTNETLAITTFTQPANGTIRQQNGALQYSPNANFSGTDTFEYTITDGNQGTAEATVTLTVTAVNDDPVATNDTAMTDEDMPVTIAVATLLANDNAGAGETGQTLTIKMADQATNGTVALSGNQITFTPNADFNGTATFRYTIEDNGQTNGQPNAKQAEGTVTVTVNPINDAPVAVADTATARASAGTITLDVLLNDTTGPDTGETLTIDRFTNPSNGGTVTIADNKIRYTPATSFSGTETFTYTIKDRETGGLEATATVTVTVSNFVEGGLSGIVAFGATRNPINGAVIHLFGTDVNGDAVDREVLTESDGAWSIDLILPGSYTVEPTSLPFTLNNRGTGAMEPVTIELTDAGLGDRSLDFTQASLHPKFAIWEALASTPRNGVYAAVSEDDGQVWSHSLQGWDNVNIVDIAFSDDMSSLTITIDEGTLGRMAATVSASDKTKVLMLGREGDARLVRLLGGRSAFNFTAVAAGAEGENAREAAFASEDLLG
jgi:cyclophilin family peptidyl-prolyl cis-trans isomerase